MFNVDPVYVRNKGDKVNDGDPFTITLSRNLLMIVMTELNASSSEAAQIMGAQIGKELNK
jgi:hypothetical protein